MKLSFYQITHESFQTDHISYTTDIFLAKSRKDALNKYNKLAKKRSEYPYMWNIVTIKEVHKMEYYK